MEWLGPLSAAKSMLSQLYTFVPTGYAIPTVATSIQVYTRGDICLLKTLRGCGSDSDTTWGLQEITARVFS